MVLFPIVLLMTALPGFARTVDAVSFNPCSGIRFLYAERIEAQGFLGLSTPDADLSTIEAAMNRNVATAAQVRTEWYGRPSRPPVRFLQWDNSYAMRHFDFHLYELCLIARRCNLRQLVFACRADTRSSDDEPQVFYSDELHEALIQWAQRLKNPHAGHVRPAEVSAACFVSAYPGQDADWEAIANAELRDRSGSRTTGSAAIEVREDQDRYDLIGSRRTRTDLYSEALRDAVRNVVERDRSIWGWDGEDDLGWYANLPGGICVRTSPTPIDRSWLGAFQAIVEEPVD